jgi:3-phenylpropionate/cinnamic acid dioxygenase small subunit
VSGEVQELRDRLDVSEMITRYAFALDRCEWDEFDSIFADEVLVELPHVPSGSTVSRAEFKQMAIDTVGGFEATHHPIANHLVTVSGDSATCKCYANAWHSIPTERGVADYVLVRGFYDWRLRRTPEGWRIDGMKIEFHGPAEGYFGVYELAKERLKSAGGAAPERR